MPNNPLTTFLAADHDRLDALLDEATRVPGEIEPQAFATFRKGLLRHIGLEEKILFPAARTANGDVPLDGFARLRLDHSRIVALLVPTPTPALVVELLAILGPHNAAEEAPGGVYARCEELLRDQANVLLERLRDAPEVPVRPHFDGWRPQLLDADPARSPAQELRDPEEKATLP